MNAAKPPGQIKSFRGLLKWLNQLRAFVLSLQFLDGLDYTVDRGPNGQEMIPNNALLNGGSATIYDLTLIGGSDSGGSPQVTLLYGTFTPNGQLTLQSGVKSCPQEFLPTNTPPMSDTKNVTAGSDNTWVAWAILTIDSDPAGDGSLPPAITSESWDCGATTPDNDPCSGGNGYVGTYYFELGGGTISNDMKTAIVANGTGKGSQTITFCNGAVVFNPAGP